MQNESTVAGRQLGLFDMGLRTTEKTGAEEFTDSAGERLRQLVWCSEERQGFGYDEQENRKLTRVRVNLKGIRRLNKKGQFDFILERNWHYAHLEEVIEDEVQCRNMEELERCFNDEQGEFEWLKNLPSNVLFDGQRYCWRFREEQGRIEFIEKWAVMLMNEKNEGKTKGNFVLGECWTEISCKHGHEVRMLNVRRNHYVVCDVCKTFIWAGSNLSRSWREESEEDWARNIDSLEGMKNVGVEECEEG